MSNIFLLLFIKSFPYKRICQFHLLNMSQFTLIPQYCASWRIVLWVLKKARKEGNNDGRKKKERKYKTHWAEIYCTVRWIKWGMWWEEGGVKRRERSGERWKLRRCSESMCLSHLHPLGSMFFNLISQPGLCVACLSAVASQGQILLQRSE